MLDRRAGCPHLARLGAERHYLSPSPSFLIFNFAPVLRNQLSRHRGINSKGNNNYHLPICLDSPCLPPLPVVYLSPRSPSRVADPAGIFSVSCSALFHFSLLIHPLPPLNRTTLKKPRAPFPRFSVSAFQRFLENGKPEATTKAVHERDPVASWEQAL